MDRTWEEYEADRAAWLSRLLFGRFVDPPMSAGPPPEPPENDVNRRGITFTRAGYE